MSKAATYDATAAARTAVQDFRVTFDYGQRLTVTMHWSIADLEDARRFGQVTADAYCLVCGDHVTVCPDVAPLLIEWPEREYTTTWGGTGTAHELGLVVFTG